MLSLRTIKKTGKALLVAALLCASKGQAADLRFSAEVNQRQISQDESVSLTLAVTSEGALRVEDVTFEAPDFDVVNEFSSSYSNSYYNNGQFGMTVTQKLTKALRPRRSGNLVIRKIRARAMGRDFNAPDITVLVTPPGAGAAPPKNYGGNGVGLRGAGKRVNAPSYLVRAVVNKDHAYKGEQIVVSYYLYRRTSIFNIEVEKFPDLKGFLREDMDMPVMGQRLDSERVLLDGVPYDRSLLVRYAAYPLEEGKLRIDPMGLKFAYRANGGGIDDGEDPFLQFFRQQPTHTTSARSESVFVDVQALPQEGRPANFTGGVGDLNVTSAVNKYEVHANEAVTFTVKVEGQGNLAAIGEPKVKWPDGMELYDSKGIAKSGKGGLGEKVFEFVIIPRVPGKAVIPPMEFSFFNPAKKAYVTKTTDKIDINVLEAAPGSAAPPVRSAFQAPVSNSTASPSSDSLRYLKEPASLGADGGIWNWIFGLAIAGSLAVILWLGFDVIRRKADAARASFVTESRVRLDPKVWEKLRVLGRKASGDGLPWSEVSSAYEELTSQILEAIDQKTNLGSRSLPRDELRRALAQDHGVAETLCDRIVQLLEFAETVRFASGSGVVSEQTARSKFAGLVKEGESIVRILKN